MACSHMIDHMIELQVDLVTRGVGVVSVSNINGEKMLTNVTFLNDTLNFHFAYAVWLPFKSGEVSNCVTKYRYAIITMMLHVPIDSFITKYTICY